MNIAYILCEPERESQMGGDHQEGLGIDGRTNNKGGHQPSGSYNRIIGRPRKMEGQLFARPISYMASMAMGVR